MSPRIILCRTKHGGLYVFNNAIISCSCTQENICETEKRRRRSTEVDEPSNSNRYHVYNGPWISEDLGDMSGERCIVNIHMGMNTCLDTYIRTYIHR